MAAFANLPAHIRFGITFWTLLLPRLAQGLLNLQLRLADSLGSKL